MYIIGMDVMIIKGSKPNFGGRALYITRMPDA